MLVKDGYKLYFYKNEKGTIEMDFFIRDTNSLIPVEVKANDYCNLANKLDKKIRSDRLWQHQKNIRILYWNN